MRAGGEGEFGRDGFCGWDEWMNGIVFCSSVSADGWIAQRRQDWEGGCGAFESVLGMETGLAVWEGLGGGRWVWEGVDGGRLAWCLSLGCWLARDLLGAGITMRRNAR